MRGIRLAMGFVGVLALSSTAAAAEDGTGFYFGIGVGQYDASVDHPLSDLGLNDETAPTLCAVAGQPGANACARNFSDSGAVWDVMAGYKLLNWLAVQADYNWYEDAQSQIPINSSRNYVVNGDAAEVSVKPSLPLFGGFLEPYVRLGWSWYSVEGKYQYVKGDSNSDNAGIVAGGVALNFTSHFAINAEYEYVDVNEGSLDSATIRFVYKMPR